MDPQELNAMLNTPNGQKANGVIREPLYTEIDLQHIPESHIHEMASILMDSPVPMKNWPRFFGELRVPTTKVEKITADYAVFKDLLLEWKQKNGSYAKFGILFKALNRLEWNEAKETILSTSLEGLNKYKIAEVAKKRSQSTSTKETVGYKTGEGIVCLLSVNVDPKTQNFTTEQVPPNLALEKSTTETGEVTGEETKPVSSIASKTDSAAVTVSVDRLSNSTSKPVNTVSNQENSASSTSLATHDLHSDADSPVKLPGFANSNLDEFGNTENAYNSANPTFSYSLPLVEDNDDPQQVFSFLGDGTQNRDSTAVNNRWSNCTPWKLSMYAAAVLLFILAILIPALFNRNPVPHSNVANGNTATTIPEIHEECYGMNLAEHTEANPSAYSVMSNGKFNFCETRHKRFVVDEGGWCCDGRIPLEDISCADLVSNVEVTSNVSTYIDLAALLHIFYAATEVIVHNGLQLDTCNQHCGTIDRRKSALETLTLKVGRGNRIQLQSVFQHIDLHNLKRLDTFCLNLSPDEVRFLKKQVEKLPYFKSMLCVDSTQCEKYDFGFPHNIKYLACSMKCMDEVIIPQTLATFDFIASHS